MADQLSGMPLEAKTRGTMEAFMDGTIRDIPSKIKELRDDETGRKLQIKNHEEFVYGWAYGTFTSAFFTAYQLTNHASPSPEQRNGMLNIFLRRIPEIKEAIFQAG